MLKKISQLIAAVKPDASPATSSYDADNFVIAYEAIVKDAQFSHGSWIVGFGQNKAYQDLRKTWPLERQQRFVIWLVDQTKRTLLKNGVNPWSRTNTFHGSVLDALMGGQIIDSAAAAVTIGRLFLDNKYFKTSRLTSWPVKKFIRQLERRYQKDLPPEPAVVLLVKEYIDRLKDERALGLRLVGLLDEEVEAPAFSFIVEGDHFGTPMNALVKDYWPEKNFNSILQHGSTAKTGKPSKKWLATARELLKPLDGRKKERFFSAFLELLRSTPPFENFGSWYNTFNFLQPDNAETVKGLLWMSSLFNEEKFSRQLAEIAVAAYKKVPNKGPLDTKTGNACVTALSTTEGVHGISQLAGLVYRIKQTGIKNKVDKILREVADKRKVSRQEIEDLSVKEFNLKDDLMVSEIGEYFAEVRLVKPGKSVLTWRKGGKVQKSIPKAIKEGFPDALTKLKAEKKALETDSINLRDRIDWGLRLNREMKLTYFEEIWQQNSLLRYFANRLIWIFSGDEEAVTIAAVNGARGWEDYSGRSVDLTGKSMLRLWHPALAATSDVEGWRDYLLKREAVQPFKQAFREVYLLTAAEERTGTYSNRMAAHILKQHQFANLARGRGWAYTLIGAYDHGMPTQACYQELPELGIRVEYIIQEMQNGDNFNDTGIWHYVSTDQIRFLDTTQQGDLLELKVIPPVLLSEVLRDTDLFTGVASIGNDDQWSDGGEDVFRNYFHHYVTRDLSGMGQNRKLALERLIPRLKIRDIATVDDKYLRVTGKIRKYKIHIGSGNILMEPNDQYLCIVPASFSAFRKSADKLYLPFEGDRTLSIIISKALLLAADDEITDKTITRQLKW